MNTQTLSKIHKLLNECARRSENNFKIDYISLCNELELNSHVFQIAIHLDFFKDSQNGYYKSIKDKYQPIDCKEISNIYEYLEKYNLIGNKEIIINSEVNNKIEENTIRGYTVDYGTAICPNCNLEFKKNTRNQKYCSELHRIEFYEKKTGKNMSRYKTMIKPSKINGTI